MLLVGLVCWFDVLVALFFERLSLAKWGCSGGTGYGDACWQLREPPPHGFAWLCSLSFGSHPPSPF